MIFIEKKFLEIFALAGDAGECLAAVGLGKKNGIWDGGFWKIFKTTPYESAGSALFMVWRYILSRKKTVEETVEMLMIYWIDFC